MSAASIVVDCSDLAKIGPVVPIRLRSTGVSCSLRSLIDTGATRTVLGEAAATPLRLARVGVGRLTTAGGPVYGWIGLVAVGIGALPAHVIRVAVISEVPWTGFAVLIGRDVHNVPSPHQGIGNVHIGSWQTGTGEIDCDESLHGLVVPPSGVNP